MINVFKVITRVARTVNDSGIKFFNGPFAGEEGMHYDGEWHGQMKGGRKGGRGMWCEYCYINIWLPPTCLSYQSESQEHLTCERHQHCRVAAPVLA